MSEIPLFLFLSSLLSSSLSSLHLSSLPLLSSLPFFFTSSLYFPSFSFSPFLSLSLAFNLANVLRSLDHICTSQPYSRACLNATTHGLKSPIGSILERGPSPRTSTSSLDLCEPGRLVQWQEGSHLTRTNLSHSAFRCGRVSSPRAICTFCLEFNRRSC